MVTERERARLREEEQAAIGPLLARANLYRLRGQWNEAVAVCTEALRQAPHSATAHSLLGDIYEAQGKLDDALQWFGMAVDLDPANPVDRSKLEQALQAKRTTSNVSPNAGSGALEAPPLSQASPAIPKATSEKTIEWFDRIFPPGRSDSIARLILVVSIGIAALMTLTAAFVYFIIQRDNRPSSAQALTPARTAQSNHPVVVVPTPSPTLATTARSLSSPGSRTGVSETPTTTVSESEAKKAALYEALSRALGATITIPDLRYDASNGQATLELLLPPTTETSDQGRERALRAAAVASRAAAMAEPGVQKVLLNVNIQGSGSGSVPALRAEVTADKARESDPAMLPTSDLPSLFSSLFVAPALSEDTAPKAATIVPVAGTTATKEGDSAILPAASTPPSTSPSTAGSSLSGR